MKQKIDKLEQNCTNIPQNILTEAQQLAAQLKNILLPHTPIMTKHQQHWAKGMTIQNSGYIEDALRIAETTPQFVNTFINLERYEQNVNEFLEINTLISDLKIALTQAEAMQRQAGINARRDFDILYGAVRDLAAKNIPSAVEIYDQLSGIYERSFGPKHNEEIIEEEKILITEECIPISEHS